MYTNETRQKARVKYTTFKEGEYLNFNRFIKTLYKSLESRSLLRVATFECEENWSAGIGGKNWQIKDVNKCL